MANVFEELDMVGLPFVISAIILTHIHGFETILSIYHWNTLILLSRHAYLLFFVKINCSLTSMKLDFSLSVSVSN